MFALSASAMASDSSTKIVSMHHFAEHIPVKQIPSKLLCENTSPNFLIALDSVMAKNGMTVTKEGEKWQVEAFGVFGYTVDLPPIEKDKLSARRTLELARHDNLVAAKIANDTAAQESSTYATSLFFRDMNLYIRNNSTPDSPENEILNSNDAWLAKAYEGILKAKSVLGPLTQSTGIKNYVLGAAMDDGLAVSASEMVLCATKQKDGAVDAMLKISAKIKTRKPK